MAHKKTPEQISYNMSQVKNKNTTIELKLEEEFRSRGLTTYTKNQVRLLGKPDFVFEARKVAVFCDEDFWHGFNWKTAKQEIHSNREFWINKIEKTMARDAQVNAVLAEQGWKVLRFWGHDIKKNIQQCADVVENALRAIPQPPYRTIDLCAGIGGIRRGFELTGLFRNVLSSEIDTYACQTYRHLFGDDPYNDLTTDEFKDMVASVPYETHKNIVIADTLEAVEEVLLFRLSNYFLKFSEEYKRQHLGEPFTNDWHEFIEYGTTHKLRILLQRSGFLRDSTDYIQRHADVYVRGTPDNPKLLKQALLRSPNELVRHDAEEVQYNVPEIFIDEGGY